LRFTFDQTETGLLVQTLDITMFAYLDWRIQMDKYEWQIVFCVYECGLFPVLDNRNSGLFQLIHRINNHGSLTFSNGLINEAMQIMPADANNLATSLMRRIFSSRSSWLKPKFEFSPHLMLSPSSVYVGYLFFNKYDSKLKAIVVLPDDGRPWNIQRVWDGCCLLLVILLRQSGGSKEESRAH
jgi:hypothetical protein